MPYFEQSDKMDERINLDAYRTNIDYFKLEVQATYNQIMLS